MSMFPHIVYIFQFRYIVLYGAQILNIFYIVWLEEYKVES